jgi:F420-dependent oxidoreductase-like protein
MAKLRFGIKTAQHNSTYDAILKVWQAADATPVFEHAWLFDHFAPIGGQDLDGPCMDGWTLLSALAAQTSRIRLGHMVLGNTYRHPAVLAHMGATLDVISGGRFDLGLGAGWNEYEHESMGIPLYAPGERIRRFGEACELIRRLWTQHLTDFDGRYYQLKQARCEPKPVQQPHPPFVLGGGGEQITLRVVARHANVWNHAGGPVDVFRHKVEVLRQHCAEVGRDPAEIELSIQQMVEYDDLPGTASRVQEYVDAGATHLILNLRYPYPEGIVQRLAEEVVPGIRA